MRWWIPLPVSSAFTSWIWMWASSSLCNSIVSSLSVEADARVPAADEVQGHRRQQQNLLWQRHPPDVCGVGPRRQLHQGLGGHGHYWRAVPGRGLVRRCVEATGPPPPLGRGVRGRVGPGAGGQQAGPRAAGRFSLWVREALLSRTRISEAFLKNHWL